MKTLIISILLIGSFVAMGDDDMITSGKGKTSSSAEQVNCKHDDHTFRCVKYLGNYDGDTIKFFIPGVHPILGNKISIRVFGIDTPEKRTKNSCEKKLANIAQYEVQKVLEDAKNITLENVQRGKYFRIVATVKADGVDVADILVKKKLAYKYYGKTKQKVDWCKVQRSIASE